MAGTSTIDALYSVINCVLLTICKLDTKPITKDVNPVKIIAWFKLVTRWLIINVEESHHLMSQLVENRTMMQSYNLDGAEYATKYLLKFQHYI